jgi:hypothetical protein
VKDEILRCTQYFDGGALPPILGAAAYDMASSDHCETIERRYYTPRGKLKSRSSEATPLLRTAYGECAVPGRA